MSLFPQSTRVDWLVVEISRRQMDFAQIPQLVLWIRTILLAVGVHKLTSPFTHAVSRMDTSKDKKFIESCFIRIPAEGIPEEGIAGGEMLASRVPAYGTKDAGRGTEDEEHVQTVQIFTESKFANSVHASRR